MFKNWIELDNYILCLVSKLHCNHIVCLETGLNRTELDNHSICLETGLNLIELDNHSICLETGLNWIELDNNQSICLETGLNQIELDNQSICLETGLNRIELPVYLNSTREELLFTVDLPVNEVNDLIFLSFYFFIKLS